MSGPKKKYRKKRLGSYPITSVTLSISLSLFVIGLLAILAFQGNRLTNSISENIELQIFLNKSVSENERVRLIKTLETKSFVNTKSETPIELLTKEEAAEEFTNRTGEDFLKFLGDNPLRDVLVLKINQEYQTADKLKIVKKEIERLTGVFEVTYPENLISAIRKNMIKIGAVLLGIAVVFLVVVIVLINNTIKLALFSQRFLIRSMQLVGAKTSFIQSPFILRASAYGFVGGLLASGALYGLLKFANTKITELERLIEWNELLVILGFLLLLGVFISIFSTFGAVRKYLKMSLDELY